MTQIVDSDGFEKLAMKFVDKDVTKAYMDNLAAISLQLLRMIMQASPVDKGRFVGSWDLTVGGFGGAPLDAGFGGSESANRRAATAAATRNAVANLKALQTGKIPDVVGLSNGLPYARELEYQHRSKKAEPGFTRMQVRAMESRIRSGRLP